MGRIQAQRRMALAVPSLGDDVLLLQSFRLTGQLGRPFSAELELLSEDPAIDYDQVLGQNVTIRLDKPDGEPRYFNGFVSRFVQAAPVGRVFRYHATVVPWLWLLTR